MPFTFHGLRHTTSTHWAMAGKAQSWLQLVAGHTDTAMTMRYLDSAAVVRGRFGIPHPSLGPRSSDPFSAKRGGRGIDLRAIASAQKQTGPILSDRA